MTKSWPPSRVGPRPAGPLPPAPSPANKPQGVPAVPATVAHTRVATRNADTGTIPACHAHGAVMAPTLAHPAPHHTATPSDPSISRRVAVSPHSATLRSSTYTPATRQPASSSTSRPISRMKARQASRRICGCQGAFEIGAEGGEQAVQGATGVAHQALDDGAVGKGHARLQARGAVQGVDGGEQVGGQGRGLDANLGGEGVWWPVAAGGACGTGTAPALAGMRRQGVHGVPEQVAGQGSEDRQAGARVRLRGKAHRLRVRGAAQGVRQHAAGAGVKATRPHQGAQGLPGLRAAGNPDGDLKLAAGNPVADPDTAAAACRAAANDDSGRIRHRDDPESALPALPCHEILRPQGYVRLHRQARRQGVEPGSGRPAPRPRR